MKFVDKADSFFKKIIKVEKALGALSLFIMLVICFSAVIMRYVFNDPWTWSEEVILVILVIFGYLCISIDVYNDEHIALTFLYNAVAAKAEGIDITKEYIESGVLEQLPENLAEVKREMTKVEYQRRNKK